MRIKVKSNKVFYQHGKLNMTLADVKHDTS